MICENENCDRKVAPRPKVRGGGGGLPKRFCSQTCQSAAARRRRYAENPAFRAGVRAQQKRHYADPEVRASALRRMTRNRRRRQMYARNIKRREASRLNGFDTLGRSLPDMEDCAWTMADFKRERGVA